MKRFASVVASASVLGVCLCVAGCSANFDPQLSGAAGDGGTIKGQVYGGNQPVNAAEVFLLETNASAYGGPGVTATNGVGGNASKSLLTSATGNSVPLNGVT